MQALQEWASSNRATDLSEALEILIRRSLGMTAELPKPKILGESKDVDFGEMYRALGLDQQVAYSQWNRMAPNEFCKAVNAQVEYAGLAIEHDAAPLPDHCDYASSWLPPEQADLLFCFLASQRLLKVYFARSQYEGLKRGAGVEPLAGGFAPTPPQIPQFIGVQSITQNHCISPNDNAALKVE